MNPVLKLRRAFGSAARAVRSFTEPPRTVKQTAGILGAFVVVGAVAAGTVAVFVPAPPSAAEELRAYIAAEAQTVTVHGSVPAVAATRESYTATPGIATLAAGGTNHDWAKLVLLLGGWEMSEANVTVITRWMRQENGTDDWWNRNNPLNNGWGSGGGGGLGSYPSLVVAAENAAAALHKNPGYSGIVASFAASSPTEQTELAIWNSPWASGHYSYGGHWSYKPVPVVQSPAGTWG
jgi:hypothetical protein